MHPLERIYLGCFGFFGLKKQTTGSTQRSLPLRPTQLLILLSTSRTGGDFCQEISPPRSILPRKAQVLGLRPAPPRRPPSGPTTPKAAPLPGAEHPPTPHRPPGARQPDSVAARPARADPVPAGPPQRGAGGASRRQCGRAPQRLRRPGRAACPAAEAPRHVEPLPGGRGAAEPRPVSTGRELGVGRGGRGSGSFPRLGQPLCRRLAGEAARPPLSRAPPRARAGSALQPAPWRTAEGRGTAGPVPVRQPEGPGAGRRGVPPAAGGQVLAGGRRGPGAGRWRDPRRPPPAPSASLPQGRCEGRSPVGESAFVPEGSVRFRSLSRESWRWKSVPANERALRYRVGEQIHGFTVEQVSIALRLPFLRFVWIKCPLAGRRLGEARSLNAWRRCFGWSVKKRYGGSS